MAQTVNISAIVPKGLRIMPPAAALWRAGQLLTERTTEGSVRTYGLLLTAQVEFELGMSILLLSGLFERSARLASLTRSSLFSLVTSYKGLTGAQSSIEQESTFAQNRLLETREYCARMLPAVLTRRRTGTYVKGHYLGQHFWRNLAVKSSRGRHCLRPMLFRRNRSEASCELPSTWRE